MLSLSGENFAKSGHTGLVQVKSNFNWQITHLFLKAKYHRIADLLFYWFIFNQKSKSVVYSNASKATISKPAKKEGNCPGNVFLFETFNLSTLIGNVCGKFMSTYLHLLKNKNGT